MVIKSHRELEVYKLAFGAAMEIYEFSKSFPVVEKYLLTGQIRRSSRSVFANIAEAYRKRRYEKSFISKFSDAEAESGETQVWLEFALANQHTTSEMFENLYDKYDHILSMLVKMQNNSQQWTIRFT